MPPPPSITLSTSTRRALKLSKLEGAFYAATVGLGEAYFLSDAIRLGASTTFAALVTCLPLFVGALGSIGSLILLRRHWTRKRVVGIGVSLQVLALVLLSAMSGTSHESLLALLLLACLHQIGGQAAGTAWSSWFGDLVPTLIRGRYFAARNRWVHLTTLFALATAGFLLQELEPGSAADTARSGLLGGTGFGFIFGLAAAARLASMVLLLRTTEPPSSGVVGTSGVIRFLKTQRGTRAWRLIVFGGFLMFFVYWGSPYFAPFMLDDLQFTYLEYSLATVSIVVAKVSLLPLWGRWIDSKEPRLVLCISVLLATLVPLPYLFAQGLGLVILAQIGSGAAWGGYEVSHFTLLLEGTYRRTRPVVFAALNLVNGSAQLLGMLTAVPLLSFLDGRIRWLFAATLLGRLAMAVVLPFMVRKRGLQTPRVRELPLRGAGFKPHGGMVQRPILPFDAESDSEIRALSGPESEAEVPV